MARAGLSPSSTPAEVAAVCLVAVRPDQRELHHAIRHEVFVGEQGFFADSDRDARDDDPATIHVLGYYGGIAAGTVRLYPLGESVWRGDRLAVLPAFRRRRVGAPLVRFAVATAGARGGRRMIAHIQPQNVPFFIHLGWQPIGEITDYVGHPHQRMEIPLS